MTKQESTIDRLESEWRRVFGPGTHVIEEVAPGFAECAAGGWPDATIYHAETACDVLAFFADGVAATAFGDAEVCSALDESGARLVVTDPFGVAVPHQGKPYEVAADHEDADLYGVEVVETVEDAIQLLNVTDDRGNIARRQALGIARVVERALGYES